MHGHSPGSAILVNAEVDSMGGVIDGRIGIDSKTSPRRAAIEKAQAELRQEYDVREERRRELEFLEKGGNPLDFKFGQATSGSVQSTSLRDQPAEQFVTSEAKGSFALTASPHGDSVESSGRPGAPTGRESNSADNLLLFDGENDLLEGERNSVNPSSSNIAPSEQSSQLDVGHNAKESEDSMMFRFVVKSQAYARRNRSRSNRDSARACSTDLVPVRDGSGSSNLPSSRHGFRDAKGSMCEANTRKDLTVSSICNSKSTSPNGNAVLKTSDNQLNMELDAVQAHGTATVLTKVDPPKGESDVKVSKDLRDGEHNQHPLVNAQQTPITMTFAAPVFAEEREDGISACLERMPCAAMAKTENQTSVDQLNGFSNLNRVGKDVQNEGQNSSAVFSTKGLDSESSCTQINLSLDGNNASDQCLNLRTLNSNGNPKEQALEFQGTPSIAGVNTVKENSEVKAVDAVAIIIKDQNSIHQNHSNNISQVKVEDEICDSRSDLQNEMKSLTNIERMELNGHTVSKPERKLGNLLSDNPSSKRASFCPGRLQSTMDSSSCELPEATLPGRDSIAASELQTCAGNHLKLANKAHEDSILEEARIIEAKRKRIAELSVGTLPLENRRKSHWDFVLEEMAWLANDFMQERIWKTTAAAQICHSVASTGRLSFDEKNLRRKQRKVAHTLAKAIMQFWRSAEALINSDDPSVGLKHCESGLIGSRMINGSEAVEDRIGEPNMEASKHMKEQNPRESLPLAVQGYAVRFFKYNKSLDCTVQAEAPMTPDRISDSGILEMSWEDRFSEESLFYTVPAGAMETYRKSVESHLMHIEKTGSSMQQEEVDTSIYDAVAEFGSRANAYEEDEGETSTYYLPGAFEGSKSSKFSQKKRKHLLKSYTARSYELGADLSYGHCIENKLGTQQSSLMGKRPANSLNVGSIPTKRVRTASRQRVVGPFSTGATGGVHVANKTDVSSGDTSSFQDDQSTLHGGSQMRKNLEVESTGDFGKQLPYDCTEMPTKPKKKKKAKHLGSAYEQGWQLDSIVQNEQRDHSRKRLDSHHFESNGNSGLFGQHSAKKPKILKQSLDTSPESITPVTGSISSPVASQMSNMSNPNKLIKMIAGRERRKTKALKMPAGQSGSGSLWSLFEDQALVVLVHDMGPNWELVSDAINSTLQFKCIFRKPKECKERHKTLMDRNAGDGADSAEDSGSSQPYPSTLPGIPKAIIFGSARQLFQRLQGPMEEDTLKAHFEKIIMIGKQRHSRRNQNDNQDLKQIAPVHNSHVLCLSQVCPNNLNGGPLTPLDLCEATTSSPDLFPIGYQGPHASGLAISNQGSAQPILPPTSGANSVLQGSSGMVLGSSLPSPSAALNASTRYGVPRPGSLPIDEQRMQQYNQMFSGRSIHQSSLSVPGALSGTDRGVRMLPGGNGMGMMCGMSRGMPMPRPGFQGVGSPAMLNSGSMLPSTGVGMPSPVSIHSGAGSGQGNSMLRPREALHMMRNPEDQRQMMMPELQMQVTQGNSQGVPPFNSLSTAFSNQTVPPPVQAYPAHHQQQHQMPLQQSHVLSNPHLQSTNHATSPQQQAYAHRLAKERQLQQRLLQQQQQQQHHHQFATSNALLPHAQQQSQHPISSLQNGSQIQQQTSSQPVSLPPNSQHPLTQSSSPMTPIASQHQQKHHLPLHGLGRNPQAGSGGLANQMLKQRQRQQQQQQQQQLQQPGRHHPQQRQQPQSQQQAKLMKGLGRGNMVMHQNLSIDHSHVNGLSMTPGNQVAEKGDQVMHLMQGQGLYSGSGSNPVQPGKPMAPQSTNQCPPQQKLFSRPLPPSSKQPQQMPSHSDNSNQGQVPSVPSGHTLLASQQPIPPSLAMASSQQQPQAQQRQASQSQQTIQRVLQQNRQMSSDPLMQSPADQVQVNQQPLSNAFQMGKSMAVPQSCSDSTSLIPIVSSASAASPWKVPEPLYESGVPNPATHLDAVGNPPSSNMGTEPMPSPSQGSGQRQWKLVTAYVRCQMDRGIGCYMQVPLELTEGY
ncbi:hypothetical protein HHK36_013051 [Tetracentron sinense]|uniref:Chromatin modification-related protein EAF1 B-like n=1 Tax=Tetracentron sinense TaxID=13715 RepID=A0A834Z5T4_TETSI|nr:hypothetical protein HHK36_013051 [Tetracentron sinense]